MSTKNNKPKEDFSKYEKELIDKKCKEILSKDREVAVQEAINRQVAESRGYTIK